MMELVSGNGFAREGYPVRGLFSIPFAGLDEDGIPQYLIDGKVTSTSINFQEREKLDYLKYEGPTDPTVTGSFGNVFTYKGFKLNVFMTYSFGNVVRLNPVFNYKYSDLTAMPREFKNRWTVSGDEARTNIPVILSDPQYRTNTSLYLAYNAYNYSTERIAKGDFIRMKEISLMYEFPRSLDRSCQNIQPVAQVAGYQPLPDLRRQEVERAGPRICEHRRGGIPPFRVSLPSPCVWDCDCNPQ